jgi:hypothetical protein
MRRTPAPACKSPRAMEIRVLQIIFAAQRRLPSRGSPRMSRRSPYYTSSAQRPKSLLRPIHGLKSKRASLMYQWCNHAVLKGPQWQSRFPLFPHVLRMSGQPIDALYTHRRFIPVYKRLTERFRIYWCWIFARKRLGPASHGGYVVQTKHAVRA